MKNKIITMCIVVMIMLNNIIPVLGFSFKDNQEIKLEKDHECISVLKIKGKDMLKAVAYVTYKDPLTNEKKPAFCVEPSKKGIGTGAGNEYNVLLEQLKNDSLWRVLYKGYMGSNYTDWNLVCDDDFYYATKTAVHCLVENINPESKYEIPHRIGRGENASLEDIKERGAKVLKVAEELYEYGVNGKEVYSKPKVNINKEEQKEEIIDEIKYVTQKYNVIGNRKIDDYDVSIKNFPKGTKVFNSEDKESNKMNNTMFKIAIPAKEIKENVSGIIEVNGIKLKTYPVFYAKANESNFQDYIIYADSDESINANTNMEVNAYKSRIEVLKLDSENSNPLEGVEFNFKYGDGKEIGDVITNKEGKIEIANLKPGKIVITEKKTLEQYEMETTPTEVDLEYNQVKEIKILNKRKKGNLKVIKVDTDNHEIKLEGVEFDLIDKDGNIIRHLITDKNGEAKISDIDIGEYILKETKTKNEYNISFDKEVKIKYKEESVIVIENTKKKGKIKILKTSEDRNNILNKEEGSPIEDTKFNIYNTNSKLVDSIVTNKDGIAISKELPLGKYIIEEIEAGKWYVLNKEKINIEIKSDEELVILEIKNKSENPKIEINKKGKGIINSGEEIKYKFEIKNVGNTDLKDFTWYDMLPTEYAKIIGIKTGIYNENINYGIYYKTNKKNEYMVINKEVNSKENKYIDLSKIHLEKDEEIIEIKVKFGDVKKDFKSIEEPNIIMKADDNLSENIKIKNQTILEGYHKEYKVTDEDYIVTIVCNKKELKKLPRTGF